MKQRFAIWLPLLCALLLLVGCYPSGNPDDTTEGTEELPSPVGGYEGVQYHYQTEVNEEMLTTELDAAYLLLANKVTPLGEDYVPERLVTLTCPATRTMELEATAAYAMEAMLREMAADGIEGIFVTSAYRSYSYQAYLFNKYVAYEQTTISADAYRHFGLLYLQTNYLDQGLTALDREDAEAVVESYSARPGYSEHQTGLCADLITDSMGGQLTEAFAETEAFGWLSEHAHRFGFILRYPLEKTDVTGYTYEPWHYRFVGREAATDIHLSGLTLEEYCAHLSASGN